MLNVLTKLLVLQEKDRQILRIQSELANLEPQRAMLNGMLSSAQSGLEAARAKLKSIEAERHKSELEVNTQKQLIEKYSLQQYQTKKNDEYRAFGQQIETCRKNISAQEDLQLELMEKAEAVQKELAAAAIVTKGAQSDVEAKIKNLAQREENFTKELAGLQSKRTELAKEIDDHSRSRYERLLKQKGDKAIVGVAHSVCGGCHMLLPPQVIISCQSESEPVLCPNCGRILYCTPDMELTPID
jgi:predicted  nucleic acid-binding Zn-ribbon protein